MGENESSEINDVAPTSIRHLIGQESVIKQVSVALDAAFADGKKFDSALLVGPPGAGKSALASVIAAEMAAQLHEVLGQSIRCIADLHALLLSAKPKDVIHVDECHELAKLYQTAMYEALDKKRIVLSGSGKGGNVKSLPLEDFTLLLSTTDEYCLLQPLRDRMKLVLRFDFYTKGELVTILRGRVQALRWEIEDVISDTIAQRARGTPRLALRLLQAARRVCRAEGETKITLHHTLRACELEGIDDVGLGPVEQRYLKALAGGASRLNVIASMLGLPAKTISEVVEPFLLRIGMVIKDDQGKRQLTAEGLTQVHPIRV